MFHHPVWKDLSLDCKKPVSEDALRQYKLAVVRSRGCQSLKKKIESQTCDVVLLSSTCAFAYGGQYDSKLVKVDFWPAPGSVADTHNAQFTLALFSVPQKEFVLDRQLYLTCPLDSDTQLLLHFGSL